MFKKSLTFIVAAALVLTMVGCSNTSTETTGTDPSATGSTTTQTTTDSTTAKG